MLEPLKIFFYCQGQPVGTLVSPVLPNKGDTIRVSKQRTEETYNIDTIEWELENGRGNGVVNITVTKFY